LRFYSYYLPATLCYTWYFALGSMLPESDAAQTELAHVGSRPAGFGTAVSVSRRAGVARQPGQAFHITGGLKLGALGGVLSYHLVSFGITRQN
jgi:hypothetical protein